MKTTETPEELLTDYLVWGLAAAGSFILLLLLLSLYLFAGEIHSALLPAGLVSGFLWLGATSMSRHSLVNLKRCVGRKLGMPEFLLTQLNCFLFPFSYRKVKKEVAQYLRDREKAPGKQDRRQ